MTGLPRIHRRDFLNGVLLGAGAAAAPASANAAVPALPVNAAAPALPARAAERTGLQGQTDGTSAAGHAWRDDPQRWQQQASERDDGVEDLVVVGAGLSGLAGAWWFREHAGRPVRMLLLDALDDIGGHARRNEFVARSGQRLVGYGGSQSLDSPGLFSAATQGLLAGIGIDLARFKSTYFDAGWARRHGVAGQGLWFDEPAGAARLVVRHAGEPAADWVARTPLPPAAQAAWLRWLAGTDDVMPGATAAVKRTRLAAMSYRDFLRRHWQLPDAVVALYQRDTQGYFGAGIEATSALDAWAAGLPGFDGLKLGDAVDARLSPSGRLLKASQDDYVYHFPDGNAGVARAMVRALMPQALPGEGLDSLVETPLDATQLDRPDRPVRLRLRATAIGLRHLGPPATAQQVEVRYLDAVGTLRTVRARQVLLACWHRVIARLSDELPARQIEALNDQVKVPLVYGTVLLSNWRAWQRAGLRAIKPVGASAFWNEASLDMPVSIGAVRCSPSPDAPILVHLDKVVLAGGGAPRAQAAAGRRLLAGWSFAHFEDSIRRLLQGALGPAGFDAARDIEAITINRWSHGYSYEYMRPWDRYWPHGPLPCTRARRGWGRVAIANADAGAYAYAHSAIDQAARAVAELLPGARLPSWHPMPGPDAAALGLR